MKKSQTAHKSPLSAVVRLLPKRDLRCDNPEGARTPHAEEGCSASPRLWQKSSGTLHQILGKCNEICPIPSFAAWSAICWGLLKRYIVGFGCSLPSGARSHLCMAAQAETGGRAVNRLTLCLASYEPGV